MAEKSSILRPPRTCIYCTDKVRRLGKGEHVIPQSIGGTQCLDCVCGKCNVSFSEIEKELVSRSPLAILVQQEFGTPGMFAWGYESRFDLALEARPLPAFSGPPLWPQLVLMGEKALFAFDADDARRVGVKAYVSVFRRCLEAAWVSTIERPKKPNWIWERVVAPDRGRYPPRVFTEHTFADFEPGITFKCRYSGSVERGRIFHQARNWDPSVGHKLDFRWGEPDLRHHLRYRWDRVLRALTKIGVNLLVWLSGPEAVNRTTFGQALAFVTGLPSPSPSPEANGFIDNADIQTLGCPPACHRFWLLHDGRYWHCDCAFFGGHLGARITFPGPRVGDWMWAEVTTPLASGQRWSRRTSRLGVPRRVRVNWRDQVRLLPSVPHR